MAEKQLYITRPTDENRLYAQLQQLSLDELQRLSGEVWTDYNPHDPGVTLSDAVNYALTEIDYKFNFDIKSYLRYKDRAVTTAELGLYSSKRLYGAAPVTAEDYRKLFLAKFPMLDNVEVEVDIDNGLYNFALRVSPYFKNHSRLLSIVEKFYHSQRNLGEDLGRITIEKLSRLSLAIDFEIYVGYDATDLLVELYYQIIRYLSGSVEIERLPSGEIGVTTPPQSDTQRDLYWRLLKVEGVKYIANCFLLDSEGMIVSDFKAGYYIALPTLFDEIKIRIDGTRVEVESERFAKELEARFFSVGTTRLRSIMQQKNEVDDLIEKQDILSSIEWRNIYDHYPIFNDLPTCYKTEDSNFKRYISLFDTVLRRGLSELDDLKRLLSLCEGEVEPQFIAQKSIYLDFLERLYGIAPVTNIIKDLNPYGRSDAEMVEKRMEQLRLLPELIRHRHQGANMEARSSTPIIKELLMLLFDMDKMNEKVHIVERRFYDPSDPFTLHILFSGWSEVARSEIYKRCCREVIAALLPAHLNVEIYHLSKLEMRQFEDRYFRKRWYFDGTIVNTILEAREV